MRSTLNWSMAGLLSLWVWGPARADDAGAIPTIILDALADPRRPDEQRQLDVPRQAARSVAFAEVTRGTRVLDFMPGNGYFTRLFSPIVGSQGRVYAYIPSEQIAHCPTREVAGTRTIERDRSYDNVTVLTGSLRHIRLPQNLDLIWTAQNYHDLHDAFLGPANVAELNRAFYRALKPGGIFLVIDHAAAPGSGLRDTDTLHRIDPARLKHEVEAAGFVLDAESDALRHAEDTHTRAVFDPTIRGRTDQVILRFRKTR